MIIIVEDRSAIADAFASCFSREGVAAAGITSEEFGGWVEAAAEDDFNSVTAFLVGNCDGVEQLATLIRSRSAAAVIAMNDARSLDETLSLFAGGFDDVVTKPCHVREIMARIAAISRRSVQREAKGTVVGDIEVFQDGREPLVAGEPMRLPRRELRILEFLASKEGRRATKAQIFGAVYGIFEHDIDENVIESHISKLRRRLRGALGYDPIESKRHLGYRLIAGKDSAAA